MAETLILKVGGMSCHHCKMAIEKAVGTIPGVARVVVDLGKGQAEVTGEALDRTAIAAAIEELGYLVEK
jgi:copper chaperone